MMIPHLTRNQRKALIEENKKWPDRLVKIPREDWPESVLSLTHPPKEVWRSRDYLVQIIDDKKNGIITERLSICRTVIDERMTCDRWQGNITWEKLQDLKRECGRGDLDAVEVYPADKDIVNVANMRHLWIMPAGVPFAWRKK